MIEPPGYQLGRQFHAGSHFSVFQGIRISDGTRVIIKATNENFSGFQSSARLEREYELTRSLDDPGVARAEAIERCGNGNALIFEDTGRISLSQYMEGRILPLESFFRIALQVAEILGRVHARYVVHKDIKPSNIIIDPQTLSAQLTDFGIAAALARETASNKVPEELEGTLSYIAPEQTGRMNRSIDARSDLYSLGVTCYEMLTRRLPFETQDPADLVHQHITRVPPPPHALDPAVPEPLSRVVMKLLAKDPEDRYQNAFGLAYDLRLLEEGLVNGGMAGEFEIGQCDVPSQLRLPERLYGREQPLRVLMRAVEQVAAPGRAPLLQISGGSGIGKSALVREVMRPIAGRSGGFMSGKFDQLNRNRPYSGIIQAFEELARKLLTESRERTEQWRRKLLDALGPNAQVILDVIPGFEQLTGKQPAVAPLGPSESQHRFNLVFRRFVRALATGDHPLVIFLDDVQWVDSASLALIEVLMTDPDMANLLLIVAYRDNEVHAGHPLLLLLGELRHAGTPGDCIALGPLESEQVGPLIADTLRSTEEETRSLSTLVMAKTGGNPFFVRQFLRTLSERGLLAFEPGWARWAWDVARIEQEQITDNVVELVAARIHGLDTQTQRLVQLAACIGNRFDLRTLSIFSGTGERETALGLSGAMQLEIVVPIGEAYKYLQFAESPIAYRFPHDRLQQAAYSTIPESDRAALHQRLGRLILEQSDAAQIEDRLFEIVNHLNMGIGQPDSDRQVLARLNLRAGNKAKAATAYEAALRYLATGTELVGDTGWEAEPQLTFDLHLQHAEAMYLCGRFEETEVLAERLLQRADAILDKVRVLELLVLAHTTRLQYRKAIDDSVRALALLGESVPARPSKIQVLIELALTKFSLLGKTIADLKELPRMEHPYKLAAMRVLMLATAPAYFVDANLLPLLSLRMARLSVRYGNANHSAYGYVMYGLVLCGVLNDMPRGLAFGRLALELVDRFNAQDIKGKVIMVFGGFILHWNGKLADTLPLFSKGANAALEAGDLEFHGYNRYAQASYAFMSGMGLAKVADLLDLLYQAVLQNKHEKTQRVFRMARQAVRDLRGAAAPPAPKDEEPFDEQAHVVLWTERDRMALAYYYKYRAVKQFMAHDFAGCLHSTQVIDDNFNAVMGMAFSAYYLLYQSLSLIALAPDMSRRERWRALRKIRHNQRRLRTWSRHAPENYLHKFVLVDAALARLRGRPMQADRGYEEAIQLAHRHGALHDEALAHELAGEFQLARGHETAGRAHLTEARQFYRRWGALAWVDHIERRHPAIFGESRFVPDADGAQTSMDSSESRGLVDVATITKAARAISGRIVASDVIDEVMKATMVNAGASRGLLLLARGNDLFIEAESVGQGESTRVQAIPFSESGKAPERVVNYAVRTRQSVVLDDAPRDTTFSDDRYIAARKPLSVLCMPLVDKGDLIGLLYLENDLARGAFTSARIQTLEVLAAQAAISLENARLYRQVSEHAEVLEGKVRERTRELEDAYGKLREIFGKYVPSKVAEAIVAGHGSLKPILTTATILYSDLEGFTTIAEHMPPEQVVQMLNEYFSTVIGPIDRNGGIVNQFQGDAMLVTFNIPIADPRHAEKAVRTATEIQEAVRGRTFAGVPLRTRIGINTGEVIAGNVGSGDRINYTVHGDAVNLAARLEQLNKQYETLVLISGTTVAQLNGAYAVQAVGEIAIRGKSAPVLLFKLAV